MGNLDGPGLFRSRLTLSVRWLQRELKRLDDLAKAKIGTQGITLLIGAAFSASLAMVIAVAAGANGPAAPLLAGGMALATSAAMLALLLPFGASRERIEEAYAENADRVEMLKEQKAAARERYLAEQEAEEEAAIQEELRRERRQRPSLQECPDCGATVSVRAHSCPNCGCPFRDERTWREEETGALSEQPPQHSVLGIAATILGTIGSVMLVTLFSMSPDEENTRGMVGALGLLLNLVGFCIAVGSFFQPNCSRAFSWLGLFISGWFCACPVAVLWLLGIILMMGGNGKSRSWVKSHSRGGRWVRGHWRKGR